ncbi:hypothetical protein B0H14DRAFT_2808681 [Mycena olivaceomarginata]|nr:hypothetical protein B0H14DRAFT_2808681 [Mycena olivaceomarginata]
MKRLFSEGFDERDVEAFYYVRDYDVLYHMPRLTSKLWHRPAHLAGRPSASSASVRSALSAGSSSFSQLRSWRSLHPSPASGPLRSSTHGFVETLARLVSQLPLAQPGTGPDFSLLERATSVFWVEEDTPRRVGSAVAAELVLLLGMNPETGTAAKARFVCGTCPPESQDRWRPLTWRDCVVHGGSYAATAASHGPAFLDSSVTSRSGGCAAA